MNDTIVQEVRDARAAIAERFEFDRSRIIAWAREQTKTRRAARCEGKPVETASQSSCASEATQEEESRDTIPAPSASVR